MQRRMLAFVATALAAVACLPVAAAGADTLNVHGTFDITDSHLLDQVIIPGFAAYDPSDSFTALNYKAEGSGAAINAAEAQAAGTPVDVILVHSAPLETGFVSGGFSAEAFGRALFYNDYVIVGPKSDPAGVLANFPHDAVGAYQAIAAAGAAGHATFVTRNDASGTNTAEQTIWGQTTTVPKHQFTGARYTPSIDGVSATFPAWYIPNGLGQGASLDDTDTCAAGTYPLGNCYTMVDRGTFLSEQAAGHTSHIEIVSQNNAVGTVGGASELTNPFHGYIVKTAPHPAAAARFLDYLTSPEFQSSLAFYPGNGVQSVFADAAPQISASSIPTHAPASSPITVQATFVYAPPVASPIVSLPVTLQSSPTGLPGTFRNVAGATAVTDATGQVTFNPTSGSTGTATYYALSTPTFTDAPHVSIFSPSVSTQIGTQNGRVDIDGATPPPSTTTVTSPAPPPVTTTTPAKPVKPSGFFSFTGIGSSSKGTITLKLRLPGAGRATVTSKASGHSYGRSATLTAKAAKSFTVKLKPSATAARTLKRHRRLHVTVSVRFSPTGGSAHTQTISVNVP